MTLPSEITDALEELVYGGDVDALRIDLAIEDLCAMILKFGDQRYQEGVADKEDYGEMRYEEGIEAGRELEQTKMEGA